MRFASLSIGLLGGMLLAGCAASTKPAAIQPVTRQYQDQAATALAFTQPIARGAKHIDLPRAEREPAIFVGFDAATETFLLCPDG